MINKYIDLLKSYMKCDYKQMYREEGGTLVYPFLTPGSASYADVLWDWDSWLSNVALKQILILSEANSNEAVKYERGCILNYLSFTTDGWTPICVHRNANIDTLKEPNLLKANNHKPILAQHAAFLIKYDHEDASWIREHFFKLESFVNWYVNHSKHKETGLYYWHSDKMIGVDNDPCTFYRPEGSSASIYLNCLMVKELEAMVYIATLLKQKDVADVYEKERRGLIAAVREHCYDERDGFYYSVDINLRPIDFEKDPIYHRGMPRHWECLIQRIDVWSGFMAMWAGIATPEQAKRMVEGKYRNKDSFNCDAGIRTLSKQEKMYRVVASCNPSCWLGPVWGISNYLTFRGLVNYGFLEDAKELCEKTIRLFGRDIEKFGGMHEYYEPDNGEPVLNLGFQNWNMLVLNMIYWYEGKEYITEF